MPSRPKRFGVEAARQDSQDAAQAFERGRGSARARGYTTAWDKAARAYKLEHPLCLGCQAVGGLAVCEVVDHVVPHKGDEARFWDRANWQPSCRWHHDVVKQALERQWAAGALPSAALRLDSPQAVAMTCAMRAGGG